MVFTKEPTFINRSKELAYLRDWIGRRPESLLFMYGPKSSGKTTLLYRFISEHLSDGPFDIKHFNLREILVAQYEDFIRAFFEHDYSREKGDVKEKREYDLKVFKLSVEVLKGLEGKELDPFVVMKKELQKLNKRGIRPVIVVDELQALDGIYMDGQRELLRELFNFFVAMTKESHLCHVIICSSDGYFIQRIYNDSKLKKTSEFLAVDYIEREDVLYWLHHLQEESAIRAYTLTEEQIASIWETFGGSCWEISSFLGDLLSAARQGQIPSEAFDALRRGRLIQMRSIYADYAKIFPEKKALFRAMAELIQTHRAFRVDHLQTLVDEGWFSAVALVDEMGNLVRHNILAYDPVTAEYTVQGRSMEIGLHMYMDMMIDDGERCTR